MKSNLIICLIFLSNLSIIAQTNDSIIGKWYVEKVIITDDSISQNQAEKLNAYMPKDSVQILMGRPQSIDINDYGFKGEVLETWKYKGTNRYVDEFTIMFTNAKLKSVKQYKE